MQTPRTLVENLRLVEIRNVFNPYRSTCSVCDNTKSAQVRSRNLRLCLEAALDSCADTIWIARDLGYRGGRRTGLPLTDEANLENARTFFSGADLRQATNGDAVREQTASTIWEMLMALNCTVMLWNIFPFHPHLPDRQLTNRCHRASEREKTWPFLISLIDMFRPKHVVAIGRDAGLALQNIDVDVSTVRHPSYGGKLQFVQSIRSIYNL